MMINNKGGKCRSPRTYTYQPKVGSDSVGRNKGAKPSDVVTWSRKEEFTMVSSLNVRRLYSFILALGLLVLFVCCENPKSSAARSKPSGSMPQVNKAFGQVIPSGVLSVDGAPRGNWLATATVTNKLIHNLVVQKSMEKGAITISFDFDTANWPWWFDNWWGWGGAYAPFPPNHLIISLYDKNKLGLLTFHSNEYFIPERYKAYSKVYMEKYYQTAQLMDFLTAQANGIQYTVPMDKLQYTSFVTVGFSNTQGLDPYNCKGRYVESAIRAKYGDTYINYILQGISPSDAARKTQKEFEEAVMAGDFAKAKTFLGKGVRIDNDNYDWNGSLMKSAIRAGQKGVVKFFSQNGCKLTGQQLNELKSICKENNDTEDVQFIEGRQST